MIILPTTQITKYLKGKQHMNLFEKIYRELILKEAVTSREKGGIENKGVKKYGAKVASKGLEKLKADETKTQEGIRQNLQNEWEAEGGRGKVNFTADQRLPIRDKRDVKAIQEGKTFLKYLYNVAEHQIKYIDYCIDKNNTQLPLAIKNLKVNVDRVWKEKRGTLQVLGAQDVIRFTIEVINKELKLKSPFKIHLSRNPEGQPVVAWHQAGPCAVGYAIMDYCKAHNININDNTPKSEIFKNLLMQWRVKKSENEVPYTDADLAEFIVKQSQEGYSSFAEQGQVKQTLVDKDQDELPYPPKIKGQTVTGSPTQQKDLTKPEKPIN